jgi:hypothetical protein
MRKLIAAIFITAMAIAFWSKPMVQAIGADAPPADARIAPFDIMQSSMPLPIQEIEDPM